MALYSLNHSGLSATTGLGKTGARLGYICCKRHNAVLLGARHGLSTLTHRPSLRALAARHEAMAGRNGRIAECFIIALPREGNQKQHTALVHDFAEKVTHGTAPWVAAIHYDRPGNPHVHLVALEQNKPRTGGKGRPSKVIGLSRKGALDNIRAEWTETHNRIMAGTGPPIDHRSLQDQGKGHRLPTLHEGPTARLLQARGVRPASRNKPSQHGRSVDWPCIDEGRTRTETNETVRRINHLTTQLQEHDHDQRPHRIFSAPTGEHGRIPAQHRENSRPDPHPSRHSRSAEHHLHDTAPHDPEQPIPPERTPRTTVPTRGTTHTASVTTPPAAPPHNTPRPHHNLSDRRAVRMDTALKSPSGRYAKAALHAREQRLTQLLTASLEGLRNGLRRMVHSVDWSRLTPQHAPPPPSEHGISIWPRGTPPSRTRKQAPCQRTR